MGSVMCNHVQYGPLSGIDGPRKDDETVLGCSNRAKFWMGKGWLCKQHRQCHTNAKSQLKTHPNHRVECNCYEQRLNLRH